jgi:hypothetical protein
MDHDPRCMLDPLHQPFTPCAWPASRVQVQARAHARFGGIWLRGHLDDPEFAEAYATATWDQAPAGTQLDLLAAAP